MRSRLLTGRMMHARLTPLRHTFEYPVYLLALDLDELATIEREIPFFGYNRRRPIALWDADHLTPGPGSIRQKLLALLEKRGCAGGIASVRLVTVPRCFGHVFNPVSFYYCHGEGGELRCAAAEVNNTYGERHLYVLGPGDMVDRPPGYLARYQVPKAFFVSPFNELKGTYDFHVGALDERFDLRLDLRRGGEVVFCSRIWGSGAALTARNLLGVVARCPLSAALALPRITWQASLLRYVRRLPPRLRPNHTSEMTLLKRPRKAAARGGSQ
ncbi:DUF1365 domain-containing protein [Sorangium sp. So ce269]